MGSRILANRYELIERIGEGGMAVVFKARDRLLNRMVAIKILRPEYTRDSLFVESFRRESQIAANLVHPNIVNIYDVGKQGNIYYIVMELIDGKPLSTIIREQGPLDPRWAADIAKEVASALSLAHKSQLIHRDVKPHNIMITKEGIAKITDFGIAKAVSRDTFVGEQKDAIMGSVHYFSPEQARGAYVDERSDIYSLGIVLYEMLTGRVPFDGETAVEVAVKHMNEQMVPPSRIKPDIPKDLEDIIMKATSKLQTGRYKNADEMITALNFVKFSRHSESSGVSKADIAGEAAEQDHGEKQDDGVCVPQAVFYHHRDKHCRRCDAPVWIVDRNVLKSAGRGEHDQSRRAGKRGGGGENTVDKRERDGARCERGGINNGIRKHARCFFFHIRIYPFCGIL